MALCSVLYLLWSCNSGGRVSAAMGLLQLSDPLNAAAPDCHFVLAEQFKSNNMQHIFRPRAAPNMWDARASCQTFHILHMTADMLVRMKWL